MLIAMIVAMDKEGYIGAKENYLGDYQLTLKDSKK